MGHVARLAAAALLLAGCSPTAPDVGPCPGTADGAIAALPLPAHQATGDFLHLLLSDAAQDFCKAVPVPAPAYFELEDRERRRRYARRGAFKLVTEGDTRFIRHVSGLDLFPPTAIPNDVDRFTLTPRGIVTVLRDGQVAEIGMLYAATFPHPEKLKALADGLFEATPEAGTPYEWSGAMYGAPIFHQGKLLN